jgi:hypothetical protein
MRRLFRFIARAVRWTLRFIVWVISQVIWLYIALIVSTIGVFSAYSIAGGELSPDTTIVIIVATAIGGMIVSGWAVSVICCEEEGDES